MTGDNDDNGEHLILIPWSLTLAFLLASPILPLKWAHDLAVTICIFLLIKWLSDYRKCTISYLECKIRGVRKESGYIYRYLDPILNLNRRADCILIYLFVAILLVLNILARTLTP